MEEILASIRRIIADDDGLASVRRERRRAEEQETAQAESAKEAAPQEAAPQQVALIAAPPPATIEAPTPAASVEPVLELVPPAPEEPALVASRDFLDAVEYEIFEDEEEGTPAESYAEPTYAEPPAPADEDANYYTAGDGASPLVSPDAAASVTAQFQTLAASMLINDSGLLHDYAREMLRPMLKAWLDDNLPVLVERLVRAEIERVARGGKR